MCAVRVTITQRQRKEVQRHLHTAQQLGKVHEVTCLLAILAVTAGQSCDDVALTLQVTRKSVQHWVQVVLVKGLPGLQRKKSPGRLPKLTKTQKHERAELSEAGSLQAGFASGCWRSPMLQHVIHERFWVYYNVFYSAQ